MTAWSDESRRKLAMRQEKLKVLRAIVVAGLLVATLGLVLAAAVRFGHIAL
jgi:hypothetical protein